MPKFWQIAGGAGRRALGLSVLLLYGLSVLGGSLHLYLSHTAAQVADTCAAVENAHGAGIESGCTDHHREPEPGGAFCAICFALARSLGTTPIAVMAPVPAPIDVPTPPASTPMDAHPFRPHTQRGPPVQV